MSENKDTARTSASGEEALPCAHPPTTGVAPAESGPLLNAGRRSTAGSPRRAALDEPNLPILLTIAEFAALIGRSEKSVRHRIVRQQIPGVVRIGRSVYLRRAEVLRFLAEGRGPSPEGSR